MASFSVVEPPSDASGSEESDSDTESLREYNFTESEQQEFAEEIKNMPQSIKVVCFGPTGVGKSTLLNGLMGVNKFKDEGDNNDNEEGFGVGHSLHCGTLKVTSKTVCRNDIEIILVDTPGLEGYESTDDSYLNEIKKECGDHDFFLYCIKSTEKKATELFDDKSSLVKFTKLFGVKLWKNAVVILTLANALEAEYEDEDNVEEAFCDKIKEWETKIREELEKLGVKKKRINKIPILPAGSAFSRDLPGHPFWLSKIFEKVTDRMKFKAKLAYLRFSHDRLKGKGDPSGNLVDEQEIGDQPLFVSSKFKVIAATAATGSGFASAIWLGVALELLQEL